MVLHQVWQTGENEASREVRTEDYTIYSEQRNLQFDYREHIESNHIDCLTFNCPFCNKEIKNRVALRSHISKNHREENMRSKGHIF